MTSEHKAVATPGDRGEPAIEEAFERLVEEGENRLRRPLLSLVSTGFLGGVDVGFGVLAYLVIEHQTGSRLLAALGFTIGFIALLLASSELFTENFLVPVAATLAKAGTISDLLRLWAVSLVMNLVGGFAMAAMIMAALPDLDATAAKAGSYYAHLGVNPRSFFLAVLAGAVLTLMTRMQHATNELGVQIVAAVVMPFVLVGSQLFHSVLDSLLMFAGLFSGQADYGYGDYAVALAWSTFGNLVGGLVLVTGTRVLRVPHRVAEEREKRS
ncbi:MAG TPA: formate/nitrite transporter family protein [Mycobacteriales bacterium]